MYAFVKNLRKADSVRRFSIRSTDKGWEVREEHDTAVVRHTHYSDWHRVERAERLMGIAVDGLRDQGWQEG